MTKWIAGWNMPGYLPDAPPLSFNDWNDARDYIIGELELWAFYGAGESAGIGEKALIALLREAMADESFLSATVAGYVYWIEAS